MLAVRSRRASLGVDDVLIGRLPVEPLLLACTGASARNASLSNQVPDERLGGIRVRAVGDF